MSDFYQQLARVSNNPFAEEHELAQLRAKLQSDDTSAQQSAGAWASCDTCCDPGTDPNNVPGPDQ